MGQYDRQWTRLFGQFRSPNSLFPHDRNELDDSDAGQPVHGQSGVGRSDICSEASVRRSNLIESNVLSNAQNVLHAWRTAEEGTTQHSRWRRHLGGKVWT